MLDTRPTSTEPAPDREDLTNLFFLFQAAALILRRQPVELFSLMSANQEVADWLMQLADEVNQRWEVMG